MALVAIANARRGRMGRGRGYGAQVRILIHSINDDRCTGCDACVAVCPTNVLDLVENKSRVLRFQDCIQCEACMWACPTTALVMHPEGTEPPKLKQPELDQYYQTAIPGQYLIGEVAGKPLVKNAANLGRGVVEHMLATGLRPYGQAGNNLFDVAIVGSGPGGMSAAVTCIQRGLSYIVFEKDTLVASTVARYPKGKLIMAEPYDVANLSFLPVFDSSKEEMVPIWRDLMDQLGIQIRMNEAVEAVARGHDGQFDIRTNVSTYRAQRVVLATGLRGKPRTLGSPGENLPKVQGLLEDPDNHRGQAVCVIGGGDSALEAAMALADAGAKVVLSYRGRSFARAQPKNKQGVESYEAQRRIKVKYQSEVVEFAPDSVTLKMADGTQKRYPNEAAFVLIGADPPIEWLATLGVHFVERAHMDSLPRSDELVRQFVPDARPCPDTAAAAIALLSGQELPPEQPHMPPPMQQQPMVVAESRSRKWLRSATNMFAHGGGNKLERPMPLSEFAKQARRHNGQGRRDKLDPRERTRVLRMLRDEGGRRADDDSKLYLLERATRVAEEVRRQDEMRRAEGSPPPAAPPRLPPPFPNEPEALQPYGPSDPYADPYDLHDPPTALPPGGPRAQVLGRPPVGGRRTHDSPKPAVIVGLARASQSAPSIRRRRDESRPFRKEESRPFQVMEPTRQMAGEDARRMLERIDAERREREAYEAREAERRMREQRHHGHGPDPIAPLHLEMEEPTAAVPPLHLEDEDATHDVEMHQARAQAQALQARGAPQGRRRPPVDNAFEEPTRAVDFMVMDDLARGSPPGGRPRPEPPSHLRRTRPGPQEPQRGEPRGGAQGGRFTRRPDEDTRSVDAKQVMSLSEVDWDLDS